MEPTFSEFTIMFSLATLMMLLLAFAIILFMVFYQKRMVQEQLKRQQLEFEFQQKMLQAELQSQETERRRLAADLHDSIGGMLSTIRVGISTMARLLPDPQSIEQTKQMLDDTITSVRRISRDLMPSTLEKFGLVHALREICERFQATSKITIHFHEQTEIQPMEKSRELMIFRVVQELLNNAIKHSQASEINVTIAANEHLYVSVDDNGIGFNAEEMKKDKQSGKGLGLFNIENRARLLGGALAYDTERQKGSKTILTLPILHEQKV